MGRRVRLAILALLVLALLVWAFTSGATHLHVDEVRDRVERAGNWAFVIFVAAYAVGVLAHIPGVIFTAAAVALWGHGLGILLAYLGAMTAITASFVLVRVIGGRPPPVDTERGGRVQKLVARIVARPIRTVALLRVIFWTAPIVNYGLPLTPLSFRDYFLGSAIGLVPAIIATGLSTTLVLSWLT